VLALRKAEERELLRRENRALRDEIRKEHRFEDILAKSARMQEIFRTITKIAEYKTTVLVTGESGVGKELVARAIIGAARGAVARSWPSTAAPFRRTCSRASCSGTRRAPSPTLCTIGAGCSKKPPPARYFSMRLASCRWGCK